VDAVFWLRTACPLPGEIGRETLRAALALVVARHEGLRTEIAVFEGEPRAIVHAALSDPPIAFRPVADLNAALCAACAAPPPHPPPWRLDVLEAEGQTRLLLTAHHMLWDGWSIHVFFRDLLAACMALRSGRSWKPPPHGLGPTGFADAERQWTASEESTDSRAYWKQQLSVEAITLPWERTAVRSETGRAGRTRTLELEPERWKRLVGAAIQHNSTPFVLMHAVIGCLLLHVADARAIVLGSPVATRVLSPDELGCFVNAVPIIHDHVPSDGFVEVVCRTRERVEAALRHGRLP
jgi:hypothetical protein